jgi:rubrerythrin
VGRFSEVEVNWAPFLVCAKGEKPPYLRALSTPEGLGDRLRFVAFAEKQAAHAFAIAAQIYPDVSEGAKKIWRVLAEEEQKHLQWLLWRMEEMKISLAERPQSLALWQSFDRCATAPEFAVFMANAEEHGRVAGEKFYETLLKIDPVTARIFKRIAAEEQEHIRLAKSVVDFNFQIPADFEWETKTWALHDYQKLITGD